MRRSPITIVFLIALLILAACTPGEPTGFPHEDTDCDIDPRVQDINAQMDQFQGDDGAYEAQMWQLLWKLETFLALNPVHVKGKMGDRCTIREVDWSQRCATAKFEVPMHAQELYCQQTANGADLLRPPSEELELPAASLVHVQQVNGALSGQRTVRDEDPDTVGRVPVEVSMEVCDEYDEDGVCIASHWEWIAAPFHYEVRAEMLFYNIVAFLTNQLACVAPGERC